MSFSRVKSAGWTDNVDPITAAQLNQLDTNVSNAVDGRGGTYTPTSVLEFNGTAGLKISCTSTAARLQYSSRSITRTSTSPIVNATSAVVSTAYGNVAAGNIVTVALDRLPNGAVLTSVLVYHNRADGSALPGTRVKAGLFKTNVISGADTTIVASTEDPEAVLANYEAHHAITLTPGVAETIDNTRYVYWILFDGEVAGGGTAATTVLYSPLVNLTVTDQDEAP